MKGIYLTEEAKQGIEAKIFELENSNRSGAPDIYYTKKVYKEILQSATILPVEESWDIVNEKTDYGLSDREVYPNGVIIQPKK